MKPKFDLSKVQPGEIDFVVFVDTSLSMTEPARSSEPNGPNRFDEAEEYFRAILRVAIPLDNNGITVYAFASQFDIREGLTSVSDIMEFVLSAKSGRTKLGNALAHWADGFIRDFKSTPRLTKKHTLALILTDGAADDRQKVLDTIVLLSDVVKTDLDLAIGVIQVGDDAGAQADLKLMDNELKGTSEENPGLCDLDIFDAKTVEQLDEIGDIEAILNDFFNETHPVNNG
jgi:hypothetical protein